MNPTEGNNEHRPLRRTLVQLYFMASGKAAKIKPGQINQTNVRAELQKRLSYKTQVTIAWQCLLYLYQPVEC